MIAARPDRSSWRRGLAALAAAAFGPVSLSAAQPVPPRLAGVVVGPDYRAAIFASPDGSWVVAGEGDTVGGFTVLHIVPGGTEVAGPDDGRVLVPEPAAASASAAAPAPAFAAPPPIVVPADQSERCQAYSGHCDQPTRPIVTTDSSVRAYAEHGGQGVPGRRRGGAPGRHH